MMATLRMSERVCMGSSGQWSVARKTKPTAWSPWDWFAIGVRRQAVGGVSRPVRLDADGSGDPPHRFGSRAGANISGLWSRRFQMFIVKDNQPKAQAALPAGPGYPSEDRDVQLYLIRHSEAVPLGERGIANDE